MTLVRFSVLASALAAALISTSGFRLELSDSSGSFTDPIVLATKISSPIAGIIPNTITGGNKYKVRVVSDSIFATRTAIPTIVIKVKPKAVISGSDTINVGQSANLRINFIGSSPWTYRINNGTSQTTSTNPLTVSVFPTATTTYTITSLSNSCGAGTTSGSTTVVVNPTIVLGTLSSSLVCQGRTFTVPFTANYTPSPNFKVELSDAVGSFANLTTIGTGISSPISVTIPDNTPAGAGYKIRIVSNSPAYSSPLSSALTVNVKPTATISGTAAIKRDQSTRLTIAFTGSAPWTYKINNEASQSTSTNPVILTVSPVSTTTYTITSVSNACGNGTSDDSAIVTVSNEPYLISCYPFNGNANDSHGNNHGVMGSAVSFTTDRFNNPNSALYFSGSYSNKYVEMPLDELINTSAYTFSLWYSSASHAPQFHATNIFTVMPGPTENIMESYGKSQSISLRNYNFEMVESSLYFGTICNNNTQCFKPFGAADDYISINTWYHVVVTRENNVVKLYKNGVLLNTIPVIATNSNLGGLKGYIGKDLWDIEVGMPFVGKIDDLKVYRRALNDAQVQAIYNQTSCKDITEVPLDIQTISSGNVCQGGSFTIHYKSKEIVAPIKVQLSDASGSFTNPIEIGTGNISPVTAQIPANQTSGNSYKIRLISSDNVQVMSATSPVITVNSLSTATISGGRSTNAGESAKLNIAFTGIGPWNYTVNNGTVQNTNTSPVSITVSPTATNTYNVTSVTNACGNGTVSGSATITLTSGPY
ncbi:MAG: hypothetical protein EOO90_25565, partial [Pedobacter sp.]